MWSAMVLKCTRSGEGMAVCYAIADYATVEEVRVTCNCMVDCIFVRPLNSCVS